MRKPDDLFDRDPEWEHLRRFVSQPGPGIHLGIVRGRRRQGKSYLLRRLTRAVDGIYYQALEEERPQALAGLGRALGSQLRVPGGQIPLESWEDVARVIQDLPRGDRPPLIVIDEFPYLLAHSPELPSLLQRVIDQSRDDGPTAYLILCASAMSTMERLLTGTQALRGRASLDLVIRAFDYRTSARFWGIDNPQVAFMVDAILGGTPGYRPLLPAASPSSIDELDHWITQGPLNPANPLFREDEYLLTEERNLTGRALYHSVISTIAAGKSVQSAIAAALGRPQVAVQHALRTLVDVGFVTRTDDALRSRRPIYRIADPIIRFNHVIIRPDLARFEDLLTDQAWADAQDRFRRRVLGPHFEELARVFAQRHWLAAGQAASVSSVAPAVINDAQRRQQHEIDMIIQGGSGAETSRIIGIGEAKCTSTQVGVSELERLDRIRTVVAASHRSAVDAKLLLFSASGFDRALSDAAAARDDVELFDLETVYGQASP